MGSWAEIVLTCNNMKMKMGKSKFTHTIVSERFSRLFASLVIVTGLLVLIGWYSKLMFLTRFSINEVPMAPSTAYAFIWLAIGLWFYLKKTINTEEQKTVEKPKNLETDIIKLLRE